MEISNLILGELFLEMNQCLDLDYSCDMELQEVREEVRLANNLLSGELPGMIIICSLL